jgi:hypothetical protein
MRVLARKLQNVSLPGDFVLENCHIFRCAPLLANFFVFDPILGFTPLFLSAVLNAVHRNFVTNTPAEVNKELGHQKL